MTIFDPAEMAMRLGFAVMFGLLLGIDREIRGKAAGMRTHMLVALGSASTTLLGLQLFETLNQMDPDHKGDPLRVIEGVTAAIGFLGAGAIIRDRGNVRGLTTAANIWLCGAIGLACGGGHYVMAGLIFGFTLVILTLVYLIEKMIRREVDN